MKYEEKESSGGRAKMALAAPVTGLNSNLEFMGKRLHIQTENVQFPSAQIITQVFSGGRVVLSKKKDHPPDVAGSGNTRKIRDLMQSQHLQVIKEIKEKEKTFNRQTTHSVDKRPRGDC
jgi:hypothetical protein